MEYIPDNADLFDEQEAEQARIHRLYERLAREEEISVRQRCVWMKKCTRNGKMKGGKYEFI